MSQARTIYDYLAKRPGADVDAALKLALNRAEEPYGTALLELVLDRGEGESPAELVRDWHTMPTGWRGVLVARADDLYRGLRRAGQSSQQQTQLNALEIIEASGYRQLADVVMLLLRKNDAVVARKAAGVLCELAKKESAGGQENVLGEIVRSEQPSVLRVALREGLDSYRLHRRQEVVLAAMEYAPANDREFWGGHLDDYESVNATAVNILQAVESEELVGFCLSAMKRPGLRPAALRALSRHTAPAFVLRAAHAICQSCDETLISQLGRIHAPRWLHAPWLTEGKLSSQQRCELAALVRLISIPVGMRLRFLQSLLVGGDASVYEKVFWQVSREPIELSAGILVELLNGPAEAVAADALHLLWKGVPLARSRQLRLALKSPHQMVRLRAQALLLEAAFGVFWQGYERLEPEQRRHWMGKLDRLGAEPVRRWCEKARDPDARVRMQALRRAEVFAEAPAVIEELSRLANDSEARVRSCAVAVLGWCSRKSKIAEKAIVTSLRDKDARVQANAVEAVEHGDLRRYQPVIEPLLQSRHNRVRANAVKALISWRVDAARSTLERMLADPRPAHRRSGRWVVGQFRLPRRFSQPTNRKNENDIQLIGV